MSRRSLPVLAAPFLLAALTGSAFAHAHLMAASPAANGMAMPPPTELRLKFSEDIQPDFSKVTVTGQGHKAVPIGAYKGDPGDASTLIVPLSAPMADGTYRVDWQVQCVDGQETQGSYTFDAMK